MPVTFEGAEVLGSAALVGGITNCGGCSRPMSVEVLIGVGNAGLATSFGLWAATLADQEMKPSAWLRIKPMAVI